MRILVTGAVGFIGFHLAKRLLVDGHSVLGFDGMTPYYEPALKERRRAMLQNYDGIQFVEGMLEDSAHLRDTVTSFRPNIIVHLAAQAGVRYSIEHPDTYVQSNLVGTANLLEAARLCPPQHLLIASTSSVYGGNADRPFREVSRTDFPVSLYAATKKACEAMSHSYAHLFKIPTTCFRFFTVYGPWGRPDMALFKFVSAIERGIPIDVYGEGRMRRDFTYVDDLIEGVVRLMSIVPKTGAPVTFDNGLDSLSPVAPWRSVNIAGGQPIELMDFIKVVEAAVGKPAILNMLPMQMGDVEITHADPGLFMALTDYLPATSIEAGVQRFVEWHRSWTQQAERSAT
ncbi:NAD-dependent epimerase/dehydratase family protein [uncultured Devosia sp.]|uniref:NAD-dependent epimerase/dehydratase family protein n=1 Tax=uncultured Devosia sp. TaxID=211434 RepID=UPI00260EF0C0|nr:NAD-dependent epimerase/dehydratase family protein [uncultured Devosia sp.]